MMHRPRSSVEDSNVALRESPVTAILSVLLISLLVIYGVAATTDRAGAPDTARTGNAYLRHAGSAAEAGMPMLSRRSIVRHDMYQIDLAALEVDNVAHMNNIFQTVAYDLSAIRQTRVSVPRVYLRSLPSDFAKSMPTTERKKHFLRIVLPIVLKVNEEIQAERGRLLALQALLEAGKSIDSAEVDWLRKTAQRYRVDPETLPIGPDFDDGRKNGLETLLLRVDSVSVALTIAQAVEETGWGRSRFAHQGNALFGQRIWRKGGGIIPENRGDGETFEVRSFSNLAESVRQYARNLNSHPAYRDYRLIRRDYRQAQLPLDALALSSALTLYSERGEAYIANLRTIIRDNDLRQLEQVALKSPADEA